MGKIKVSNPAWRAAQQRIEKIGKPNKSATAFVWSENGKLIIELPYLRKSCSREWDLRSSCYEPFSLALT